jgi:hypothetical protein
MTSTPEHEVASQSVANGANRREFLGVASIVAAAMGVSSPAAANDQLFKANSLTNQVLEQVSQDKELSINVPLCSLHIS